MNDLRKNIEKAITNICNSAKEIQSETGLANWNEAIKKLSDKSFKEIIQLDRQAFTNLVTSQDEDWIELVQLKFERHLK